MPVNICMVSDFFYPSIGGVEAHIYNLSQCLIKRGHKVIVITHAHASRRGARYLSAGLKVYYLPVWTVYAGSGFPTVYGLFPILRDIFVREDVEIVHGHQALSSMCQESILLARTMGIPAVFTDHSLFGFADTGAILTNKLLKFTLSDADAVICVSNTSKENTVLRAAVDPRKVYVIPNAIVSDHFMPDVSAREADKITIVVTSRLVYRKGIDLLVAVIPRVCAAIPNAKFVIAGDGAKRVDLEQMRERYVLHDRVELLGSVPSSRVRDVLIRGHIFLNTSLTEAFCIAILEAASCGLLVVSTKVGGIPEILPDHMIMFAEPDENDLYTKILHAATLTTSLPFTSLPSSLHAQIRSIYSWPDVARRTETVYTSAISRPPRTLVEQFKKYNRVGVVAGKISVLVVAVAVILMWVLELVVPSGDVERAPWVREGDVDAVLEECRDRDDIGAEEPP